MKGLKGNYALQTNNLSRLCAQGDHPNKRINKLFLTR